MSCSAESGDGCWAVPAPGGRGSIGLLPKGGGVSAGPGPVRGRGRCGAGTHLPRRFPAAPPGCPPSRRAPPGPGPPPGMGGAAVRARGRRRPVLPRRSPHRPPPPHSPYQSRGRRGARCGPGLPSSCCSIQRGGSGDGGRRCGAQAGCGGSPQRPPHGAHLAGRQRRDRGAARRGRGWGPLFLTGRTQRAPAGGAGRQWGCGGTPTRGFLRRLLRREGVGGAGGGGKQRLKG